MSGVSMRLPPQAPVEDVRLQVGQQVRFEDDRLWWTVRAVSDHFVACVRPAQFSRLPMYTVLDWRNGVRGPCNLIGQGWGDGTYSEQECAEMLTEFESIETVCQVLGPQYELEVSHRNRVPLLISAVR